MAKVSVSRGRKPSQRPGSSPALASKTIEEQRQELFALVAIAAALAQVIDDEYAPALELISRMADDVATQLEGVRHG